MGFSSGKSFLCNLFRGNFPGTKLSSHSVIKSIGVINTILCI